MKRVGGLQIEQDLAFQRREWRAERVGWALIGLVVLAMVLGLFGGGPLSGARASDEQGRLRVGYERFARRGGRTTLEVSVPGSASSGGTVQVWLPNDYLVDVTLEQITPEPDSQQPDGDGVAFTFAVPDPAIQLDVAFHLQPGGFGLHRADVRLGGSGGPARVRVSQFFYP